MEKLLTTEQVAKAYGVSSYTITQNWCSKGLKFIRGNNSSFMFKEKWVEDFLEKQAERESSKKTASGFDITVINKTIRPHAIKSKFNKEMKIV